MTQTQVFDASTFKKDRNLVYTLNRYKYYVLSFILLVVLVVYLVPSDLLDINQNNSDSLGNLKEENKTLPVKDSMNIESLDNQRDNSNSTQTIKNSLKIYNDVEEEEYSEIAKAEPNARANEKVEEQANAEEKKIINQGNVIKNLLGEAKDFLKTIKTKKQNFQGKKEDYLFINFDIAFNNLNESVKNKKTDNLKQEMNNLNSQWIKIEQDYDQRIKVEIEKGQKIISELEKITIKNEVYQQYVKIQKEELEDSFETKNISVINNKYNELIKQKTELDNRISIEKEDNIRFKPYLWDLNSCGIKKPSHYGAGLMYVYQQDDNEINKIYLEEKKEIKSLKEKGYELSDKKEKTLKKDRENEVIVNYKVFFTKENFKNKTFDRFLNCSGETENQIYVLKKLN